MKFKDILNIVTDVIPLGTIAKTIGKGAVALLTKKVSEVVGIPEKTVEDVFVEANKIAEQDIELKKMLIEDAKAERQHELDFFGQFAQLDIGSQKLRARVRPLLSFGLIGTFILVILLRITGQLFPYLFGLEFLLEIPPELVKVSYWVVGFWFGGRTVEKIVDTVKNGK